MLGAIKRYLIAAFSENMGLKTVSLLIATVLFVLIRVGEKVDRRVFVDVVVQTPDKASGKVVVGSVVDRVKLTVRGPRSLMSALLKPGSIQPVVVDLRNFRGGTFHFDEAMFKVPAGFEIVQISPPSFQVVIDKLQEIKVNITPNIRGSVAPDHRLVQPFILKPSRISLIGPASRLRQIKTLRTEPVSVEGLTEGIYVRNVPVIKPWPEIEMSGSEMVEVKFNVEPMIMERRVQGLSVSVIGAGDAPFRLNPSAVSVRLKGPRKSLDSIQPEHIMPFIEISAEEGSKIGRYRKKVKVSSLPPGIKLKTFEPSEVVISISRKKRSQAP